MSEFELAIETVLQHEGGFSNDPADAGGATKYGISQRYLQAPLDTIKNLTQEDAIQIYKIHWWEQYNYAAITHQSIATKTLDLAINIGAIHAHKLLQRACWSVKGRILAELKDTGIFDSLTVSIVNSMDSEILLSALRSEAAGYYRSLNKPKFEKGWLSRAYS